MFEWLDRLEVAEKGFPCPRCVNYTTGKSTGWAFGFEQNGICPFCEGTQRIKNRKTTKSKIPDGIEPE